MGRSPVSRGTVVRLRPHGNSDRVARQAAGRRAPVVLLPSCSVSSQRDTDPEQMTVIFPHSLQEGSMPDGIDSFYTISNQGCQRRLDLVAAPVLPFAPFDSLFPVRPAGRNKGT